MDLKKIEMILKEEVEKNGINININIEKIDNNILKIANLYSNANFGIALYYFISNNYFDIYINGFLTNNEDIVKESFIILKDLYMFIDLKELLQKIA